MSFFLLNFSAFQFFHSLNFDTFLTCLHFVHTHLLHLTMSLKNKFLPSSFICLTYFIKLRNFLLKGPLAVVFDRFLRICSLMSVIVFTSVSFLPSLSSSTSLSLLRHSSAAKLHLAISCQQMLSYLSKSS